MAERTNSREKIIRILEILYKYSDDSHGLTNKDIQNHLEEYSINADRKSIYYDIKFLEKMGMDIIEDRVGTRVEYHIGSRLFELAELKLLVDIVQSSRFITSKKSTTIIKKLCELTSVNEAATLKSNVVVSHRIKSMNESIFINTDIIQSAIMNRHRLRFRYFSWDINKEKEFHRGGAYYIVEPITLVWNNTYYYLVGYDVYREETRHYRVDKIVSMTELDELTEKSRSCDEDYFVKFNQNMFEMYNGTPRNVTLKLPSQLANVIVDRFGTDLDIHRVDDNTFEVTVNVVVSGQFYGWLFGLDGDTTIVAPDDVREEYERRCRMKAGLGG